MKKREDQLEQVWWGCRRCPMMILSDHWTAHGYAHALVEAARVLRSKALRAVPGHNAPLLCGLCGTVFSLEGPEDALMDHLQTDHFEVMQRAK